MYLQETTPQVLQLDQGIPTLFPSKSARDKVGNCSCIKDVVEVREQVKANYKILPHDEDDRKYGWDFEATIHGEVQATGRSSCFDTHYCYRPLS